MVQVYIMNAFAISEVFMIAESNPAEKELIAGMTVKLITLKNRPQSRLLSE